MSLASGSLSVPQTYGQERSQASWALLEGQEPAHRRGMLRFLVTKIKKTKKKGSKIKKEGGGVGGKRKEGRRAAG